MKRNQPNTLQNKSKYSSHQNDPNTVSVSLVNIAKEATDKDLYKLLDELGIPKPLHLRAKHNQRYETRQAFLNFPENFDAESVIKALNGYTFMGFELKASIQFKSTVVISGFHNDEHLKRILQQSGILQDNKLNILPYDPKYKTRKAYLYLSNNKDTQTAVKMLEEYKEIKVELDGQIKNNPNEPSYPILPPTDPLSRKEIHQSTSSFIKYPNVDERSVDNIFGQRSTSQANIANPQVESSSLESLFITNEELEESVDGSLSDHSSNSSESSSHSSELSSDSLLTSKERRESFILNTYKRIDSEFTQGRHLMEYVKEKTIDVLNSFYNKEEALKQSRRGNLLKNEKDLVVYQQNEMAIESEFELVQRQKQTFNDVRRRLMSLKAPIHILKAVYDREYRRAMNPLPFYAYRNEIIEKLTNNDIMILMGSTGSGKSTQIAQYLLEAGFAGRKKIVCTEPRKVAAISLHNRISEELDCVGTDLVQCKIQGQSFKRSKATKLLFMTDRSLLNEYQKDRNLESYSVIIIDEAHERSLFTDILLCELKNLVKRRRNTKNPLKLIITSATLNEKVFGKYFDNCYVLKVPGQMYTVKEFWEKAENNYVNQVIWKLKQIIDQDKLKGDVLAFLTSPEEVEKCCTGLIEKREFQKTTWYYHYMVSKILNCKKMCSKHIKTRGKLYFQQM